MRKSGSFAPALKRGEIFKTLGTENPSNGKNEGWNGCGVAKGESATNRGYGLERKIVRGKGLDRREPVDMRNWSFALK
jgi:hypothetical protein